MANFIESLKAIDPALVTEVSRRAAEAVEAVGPRPGMEVGSAVRGKLADTIGRIWRQPEGVATSGKIKQGYKEIWTTNPDALELKAMLKDIVRRSGYRQKLKEAAKEVKISDEYKSAWGTYEILR